MLKEIVEESIIGDVISGIREKIIKAKNDYDWKQLFIETGDFLTQSKENSDRFHKDLLCVFSNNNMKKMAKELEGQTGYKFKELLHNQLYSLIRSYEIDPLDAEAFSHHFMEIVLKYLEDNMQEEFQKIFLAEWREEEEREFVNIKKELVELKALIKKLDNEEATALTIREIDAKLKQETVNPRIGLDFFEIDDEEFLNRFFNKIEEERLYIVGKSREETVYCILNEIQKRNINRQVLVVTSEKEWKKIGKCNLENVILIPFFCADTIVTIPKNTNVFVFGENEPCYSRDKIKLRKRTMKSIIHSLENAGLDSEKAFRLAEDTHGLYVPMKRRIFNGAAYQKPEWAKTQSDIFIAALLCSKWTDYEGDKLVIEELSGVKYEEFMKTLSNYKRGENPFIVEIDSYGEKTVQLASVENTWEELDSFITDDIWNKFIELFYEVLIESEPIFNYPFRKHFEASVYAKKPEWSPTLKHGMIRSLIMRAYYRGHEENQYQVDNIVSKVLDTVSSKSKWGYIAQYFTDLCEAAPESILKRLESEFEKPTGMVELFSENDGDMFKGRNYYTHILWAVEQLIQQKKYVVRAVNWLWKMDSYNIEYRISNSPKSMLEIVFCAWLNTCALSVEQKINLAKQGLENYENAWDIIYSELPNGTSAVCTTLNIPIYRVIDEPEDLYMDDVSQTYMAYFEECINHINVSETKWNNIISLIGLYPEETQEKTFEKLIIDLKNMSDEKRISIKNKLRNEIYRNRYFADADWAISEKGVQRFENIMNEIRTDNPVYEYLYLFTAKYDFPLLHPIPFERETQNLNIQEKNRALIENEIEEGIVRFQNEELSLRELLELSNKDEGSLVGECIAKYYGDRIYNKDIIYLMLEINSDGEMVYDYVHFFALQDEEVIKQTIEIVKEKVKNDNLVVELLSLAPITLKENSLISREEKCIKKLYWSRDKRLLNISDADTFRWAISECRKYGTINVYLEILFDAREILSVEEIYAAMLNIEELEFDKIHTMTDYYLQELLKKIQRYVINDDEKCIKVYHIEFLFRKVLNWNNMICTQYLMKKSPVIYAQWIDFIYLKEGETKEMKDRDRSKTVESLFDIFYKAHFCPAEENGEVDYEKLNQWVAEFKELLIRQKQAHLFGHLIGRVFAYSPIGKDNYMPCESVRKVIEDNFDESLKNSYMVAEENKRGVYTPNAGKTEMEMSKKYKINAEALRDNYPKTAQIFDALSESYRFQAERERKSAEDEW